MKTLLKKNPAKTILKEGCLWPARASCTWHFMRKVSEKALFIWLAFHPLQMLPSPLHTLWSGSAVGSVVPSDTRHPGHLHPPHIPVYMLLFLLHRLWVSTHPTYPYTYGSFYAADSGSAAVSVPSPSPHTRIHVALSTPQTLGH